MRHKFPGLELSEVQRVVAKFSEVSERFRGIRVEPVAGLKHGFRLSNTNSDGR